MDYKTVDLQSLNSGAAVELFEEAFEKVLDNISDPNTDPRALREIRLVVKIKPNEERSGAVTTVSVASKLANVKPHESFIVLGTDGSGLHAYVSDPKQKILPGIEPENIITINGGKNGR